MWLMWAVSWRTSAVESSAAFNRVISASAEQLVRVKTRRMGAAD